MKQSILQFATAGVQALKPYAPGKPLSELEREYGVRDAVKLASNENPLGPSARVVEALQAEFSNLARYPDGNGFELKAALAAKHGVSLDDSTAYVTNLPCTTCAKALIAAGVLVPARTPELLPLRLEHGPVFRLDERGRAIGQRLAEQELERMRANEDVRLL